MPIFPCFDPTTGASGGSAPSGGASLSNIPLRSIDPTGFAVHDPDSLLKSTAYAAGTTTYTLNALAVGSTDYALNGSAHRFPRLSTDLTADDGDGTFTTITSDDYVVVYYRLRGYSTTGFNARPFVAVAVDPASTVPATMAAHGTFLYKPAANPGSGLWDVAATLQAVNASFDAGLSVAVYAPTRAIQVDSFQLDASGVCLNGQNRLTNDAIAAATPLKLVVGVATEGSATIAQDDQITIDMQYQVFKLTI